MLGASGRWVKMSLDLKLSADWQMVVTVATVAVHYT